MHTDTVPENLTRKAASGAGWSAFASLSRQLLALGAVTLLARRLGPSAYGLMGMAGTVMMFLTNFRDLGTAAAVVQRPEITQAMLSTLFWANVGIGVVLSGLLVLASAPIAAFFREPELIPILRVLSISFVLVSAGIVHNGLLSRQMKFRATGLADLASAIGGYALAITLTFFGFGVWSLVYSNVAASLIVTGMYWGFSGWRPSLIFSREEIRNVAAFSVNLSGFGLVNYFARSADNLIIGRYLGAIPLGQYQMAYNLMMYPIQNVTSVISQVLLPAFSRLQHENERFAEAYVRSCCLIGTITFPLIAGLGVVAPPLVHTMLGPKWILVIPVFQILAPVGLFQSVHSTVGHIYIAKGRTDWMFRWGLVAGLLYVTSFLIGVRYGIAGVAISYAAVYFLVLLVPGLLIPFRLIDLKFSYFVRQLGPQLLITAAMVVVSSAWLALLPAINITNPWIHLISTVIVGAATYILLILYTRPPVVGYMEQFLERSNPALASRLVPILRFFRA